MSEINLETKPTTLDECVQNPYFILGWLDKEYNHPWSKIYETLDTENQYQYEQGRLMCTSMIARLGAPISIKQFLRLIACHDM